MLSQFVACKNAWGSCSLYRIPRALGNEPNVWRSHFLLVYMVKVTLIYPCCISRQPELLVCMVTRWSRGDTFNQALYILWNQRSHGLFDHRDSCYYRTVPAVVTGINNGAVLVFPPEKGIIVLLSGSAEESSGVIFLLTVLVPIF